MLKRTKEFLNLELNNFNPNQVIELQEIIKYHSDLYHNKGKPSISDYEYDVLLKKLVDLEEKFNIENKIGTNVGEEIVESTFDKVKHSKPMISLDNTYNEDDLIDFDKRIKKLITPNPESVALLEDKNNIPYIIEFKFDGLGVELIYKDGIFTQAITRGNGIQGEDVTENVRQIENIPKKIDVKGTMEIRGEVVMPISSFKSLNNKREKEGENLFSNPRNAASGSLRTIDISVTKERNLKFFGYDVPHPLTPSLLRRGDKKSYYDLIKKIDLLGFETSSYFKQCKNITDVIDNIDNFGDLKKTLDFEIDGLVIKVDNLNLWKEIGMTEHHPRYAIAYKFPAELITTVISGVEHSVGRTGTITPVALLDLVNIGGVNVSRASLHNYDEVRNKGVKIGDNVFVKRAGEVIPEVVSVIKEERTGNEEEILIPTSCPVCEGEVLKDEDKVRYYCSNSSSCPAQLNQALAYSVGKTGFNIDGLGIRQVEVFLKEGIINNIVDIFNISSKKEEILALEGFQRKSVDNLIESVEKTKNVSITVFLTSLGISGVGKKTSRELSKLFKDKNDLRNFSYSMEDLENLDDIGPEIASNVVEYFKNEDNIKLLNELLDILTIKFNDVIENKGGIFFGKKVCITGSFDNYKRDDLVKILEENGGEFMSSVTKKTDFLLAGDKAGSKLKKANELGIKVLKLEGFLEKIK